MSLIFEKHNNKTLSIRYGLTYKQFYRKLKLMKKDKKFAKLFGKYSYPFTKIQLELIVSKIGDP